jgi:phage tail-like protein
MGLLSGGGLLTSAAKRLTGAAGFDLDPFRTYNFVLDVHGIIVGGFTTIEGVGAKVEVKRFHQGGQNDFQCALPERVTYGDLVLSSGLTFLDPMWLWWRSSLRGKPLRKNGTIYLLDHLGVPSAAWDFHNAWPIDWVGPSFDASQSLVAVQHFTLVCESIKKSLSSSLLGAAGQLLENFL